jgi:hypothetical protein
MTTFTQEETHRLLERFPQIELSYETTPHKKVPPSYNICLGIPIGKKCFVWFSYLPSQNIGSQTTGCSINSQTTGCSINSQTTGCSINSQTTGCSINSQTTGCSINSQTTGCSINSQTTGCSINSQTTGCSINSQNKCFVLEVNKDKKIGKVEYMDFPGCDRSLFLGTVFYGTFYIHSENHKKIFLIEDIFFYKGIPMKGLFFGEKLGFLEKFFQERESQKREENPFLLRLPTLWCPTANKGIDYDCTYEVPARFQEYYSIHHIQYRSLTDIVPYLNIFPTKKTIGGEKAVVIKNIMDDLILSAKPQYRPDFYKPQYRQTATFIVKAEIAFDIYRLYAYGKAKELVFYGIAYIPNPTVSIMMNKIFRKIKENGNLDAIEESDDEEDFENIDIDKYVDLKKSLAMECRFHMKFKKWVPIRVVDSSQKIVHIGNLVADYR